MKYLLTKEKKNRLKVKELELDRIVLISLMKNSKLPLFFRQYLYFNNKYKYFYPYKTIIKNRCNFTNRGRSVFIKFRMSRISLKRFLVNSKINGIKKTSW